MAASRLPMANDRLRALEDVEKEIAMVLQCAGEKGSSCGCYIKTCIVDYF